MKTILVVDDEYAIAEILMELLQDEGYRVVSAANGKDGLDRLQKEKPDLIFVDHMMPIAGGREFIQGMRALANHRSIPIVMWSASQKSVALSDGHGGQLEVSAFLAKPFGFQKLLDIVGRLIGKGEPNEIRH